MPAAACTTTIFKPVCPPIASYSAADQDRAAAEYDGLPSTAMLRVMMDDYGHLRKQCRALTQ